MKYDIRWSMVEDKKLQQTVINAGSFVGSKYAQLVNVTVTDLDITFEFAFINPRDPTTGQVVARVTMPKEASLQLPKVIVSANSLHEARKGGKTND
jgi:hypothetical protein